MATISQEEFIFKLIMQELERARGKFRDFDTYLMGHAAIQEEVDELLAEVRKKGNNQSEIVGEAIQVAAMIFRFLSDCDLFRESGTVGIKYKVNNDRETHRYYQGMREVPGD